MKQWRLDYPVKLLCRVLAMSRSGFYAWLKRPPCRRDQENARLRVAQSAVVPADVLPEFQKYLCGSHVIYFLDYPDHLAVIRILHQQQDVARNALSV